MRFRRFAQLAAVVAACALVVSACNGDLPEGGTITDGNDTTTTSASPSASPTPSAAPTVDETEEMRFVRDFVASLNKLTADGDTKTFLSKCTSKSESCKLAATSTEDVIKAGGSFDGPTYSIGEWAMAPSGNDPVTLQVSLNWSDYSYVEKKGVAPKSGKAGDDLYEFHLVREGSTWKVQEYFVP